MSHISTGVEYALHCMLFLAGPAEASAKDLADLQGIPAEYVAKLFTKLNKAGLVRATEGIRGGFALALPPEQISVLDVVDAIDGKKALFDCREIRQRCAIFEGNQPGPGAFASPCSIHAVMMNAEQAMRDALAQQTVASLANTVASVTPASYGESVMLWLDKRAANKRPGRGERAPQPD